MKKLTKFEKFLINRGLLETFEKNLIIYSINFKTLNNLLKYENSKYFIFKSFTWSSTSQGHYFWKAMDEEWKECLKYNKL